MQLHNVTSTNIPSSQPFIQHFDATNIPSFQSNYLSNQTNSYPVLSSTAVLTPVVSDDDSESSQIIVQPQPNRSTLKNISVVKSHSSTELVR